MTESSKSTNLPGIIFQLNSSEFNKFQEIELLKIKEWKELEQQRIEIYKKDIESRIKSDEIKNKDVEDFKNYRSELLNNVKEQNKLLSEINKYLKNISEK